MGGMNGLLSCVPRREEEEEQEEEEKKMELQY